MALDKNLNVPPYNIDYDANNRYHALLFRPHTAVQARELSEIEFILQDQIRRLGEHMFKDGTVIEGVGIIYHPNTHYISLEDYFNIDANAFVTDYNSSYLITNSTDSNNAVRAVIKIGKNGVKAAYPETNRIYFDYITTGTDGSGEDVNVFSPGDILYFYSNTQNKFGDLDANNLVNSINTLSSNVVFNSNGYAYLIGCTDGIVYQKGYFIKVPKHVITVRDFSTNVSGYVVGFETTEEIIDEYADPNLYDNALGYSNENAPGAHRLKLTPELVAKSRTDTSNNINFFSIVEFDGDKPTEQKENTEYNKILDQFAVRTYEESGDYVTKPFQIETRVNEANSQSFFYEISSGIGYVRGHRIEKINSTRVEADKGITTEYAQNQIITGNYGNYVICSEFLGAFDFETLSQVTLYDQPQYAITDKEGAALGNPIGNAVGTASVRAIVFYNGTKGLSSSQYLVYLTDIRMNADKSFNTDVKSLYASHATYGKAKADIVLESGLAVLKSSGSNKLIFNTALTAIKRLTDNTGIGDTLYVYDQIKPSTINSNGAVTVTLRTAAPGSAEEKLTSTTGSVLIGSQLNDYNIILSTNAYSANLTGNIAFSNSSNITITGTGTLFTTELVANNLVRITANSTQTYIRRVTGITNSTSLTIDSPINDAAGNTSTKIQRFYIDGTVLSIANVTINSNTSFTSQLGVTLDSGTQNVYCSFPVYRNQASAISKVINKNRYVKIDCSNNVANTVGPWDLGLVDVHKIRHVYVGTTYANTNSDRSNWFELYTGQSDDKYSHSKLVIKPTYRSQITSSTKMLIELDHFTANTSYSVGFFSVESYPIDDTNTSNTNAIQTIEIPVYNGVELRNVIDYRPRYNNSANNSTTEAGATINPVVNTTFSVSGSGQYVISPDTNFIADFEYYLPRYDLITLDPYGNFKVQQGNPAVNPVSPFFENDQSLIAECYVPPYPTPTVREQETYNTNSKTLLKIKSNKRYTMKDIASLEKRIKKIEYYTVLNSLEQQAKDLTIPDSNGLDRFKNGIFADPFNSHNLGNVSDFEYKIAVDPTETVIRPFIVRNDIDMMYSNTLSSNVVITGPYVTLSYTDELYINQNMATKFRNCAEAVWQWNGKVSLYPSYDFHRDEDTAPNVNVDIDLVSPWEQFANSPWGSRWGDWRTVSSDAIRDWSETWTNITEGINAGASVLTNIETITATNTQERTSQGLVVDVNSQTIDLGSYVKDVALQPYMASRLVSFVAYNMKPNTTLHAFFDAVNVDIYCAPGTYNGNNTPYDYAQSIEDNVVSRTGNFGDALVSDANGFVSGVFLIPAETFRTGDRIFQLTNVDDLVTGADARLTLGKTTYTADSLSVTRTSTTINVRQPEITVQDRTERRTSTTTSENISQALFWPQWDDPIAQSFTVVNIPQEGSGLFLSKVGVFFKSKDENLGVSLYICEMENSTPNENIIIGKSYKKAADITVSSTSSAETEFTLDFPVYLMANKDYAFIVQPDGNSPEYTIWVGETGGFDVLTNQQVYSNPYSGTAFISSNRKTWTPIQKEDLKFKLYRAKFNSSGGYAGFTNENDEFLTVSGFTKANSNISIAVGDIVYRANTSANTANLTSIVSNTLISNSTNNLPKGRIQYFNEETGEVWLDSSANGGFSNSDIIAVYRPNNVTIANSTVINANTLIAWTTITTVDNKSYHIVVPKFGIMQPSGTSINYEYKGVSNTNVADSNYQIVQNNMELEYIDKERHIMSKSNEVASLSSAKSGTYKISFATVNDYVSPVINLSQKTSLFIENQINNDTLNEHTRYGNSSTKYISKKIILEDDQDAEDVKMLFSAYRPSGTDIKAYIKIKNAQDFEDFNDKNWTELEYIDDGDEVYSSSSNKKDFREYELGFSITRKVYFVANNNSLQVGETITQSSSIGTVVFRSGNNVTVDMESGLLSSGAATGSSTGSINIVSINTKSAFSNSGVDIYEALPGGVEIGSSNVVIVGKNHTFNANTGINNAADVITITNANTYFSVGDAIMYHVSTGNTAVSGLTSNTKYYVSFANTTGLALASTRTGANINITASSISETGHTLIGSFFNETFDVGDRIRIQEASGTFSIKTITSISNNTYLTIDTGTEFTNTASLFYVFKPTTADGVVEYYDSTGTRYQGYKEFAIKLVLLSSNPVLVPKIDDVRGIALQV